MRRVDEGSRPLEAGQDPVLVTVRVAQKEGWIVVSIPDVAPGTEITSLQRDGQELPLNLVWREGSQVHFLDDPVTEYTLGFNQGDAKPAGVSWLLAGAIAAGAVLLVALVVLALRRR